MNNSNIEQELQQIYLKARWDLITEYMELGDCSASGGINGEQFVALLQGGGVVSGD